MNIYMVSRWGNEVLDEFERGPDGPDTNFLVRAKCPENAALLVNEYLTYYSNEGVRDYCEHIAMLGEDKIHSKEAVIHGPFISHAFFSNKSTYKSWQLESRENNKWEQYEPE
ncbi:hypothetical protein ACJJIF_11975 [Microbulbifer sp. SSSA002]|uniref:hypothetical protein n=1 Tax=unclassified Microbulbifer TaxID=2619833 RepID=UPI00403A572D